jgi:hypothetical protein
MWVVLKIMAVSLTFTALILLAVQIPLLIFVSAGPIKNQ